MTNKEIECACGCKQKLNAEDIYGRVRKFVNGHNGRKYADPTQHKREWNHRNRGKRYLAKTKRTQALKATLIKERGAKCISCGFSYDTTNACCFDFHHKIPKDKKFSLGLNMIANYSLKKTYEELKKCDLLCSNCHRLKHSSKY